MGLRSSALSQHFIGKSCESLEAKNNEYAASTDIERGVSNTVFSRFELWMTAATFFLLGVCSLFTWNCVLYMLPYITEQLLDGWDAGNSLLGAFQVGNLSIQLLLLLLGSVHEGWLQLGLFLSCILYAAIGPCILYGTFGTRIAMLHVFCLLIGGGSGFMQGSGLSIASILPVKQVGIYSTGQGFGAILSVVLIGMLSFTAVDLNVKRDVVTLIHITSAVSVTLGISCMILTAITVRQSGAKQALAGAQAQRPTADRHSELQDVASAAYGTSEGTNRPKSLYEVVKLAGVPTACIFVLFFVTCNLFPRVGPTQWHTDHPPKNHLVWLFSIFPFGDTLGKFLCTFAEKGFCFKMAIMPTPKLLPLFSLLRFGLYVPFFLSKHLVDNALFSAFSFQALEMVVLSVTHGWLCTVAFMYSFNAVPDAHDKRRVGPLCTLSFIFAILAGLYLALLYK